jgi:hypothetical protein
LPAELLQVDEGFTMRLARWSPAEIVDRTAQDTHPPLHYLLLHAWQGLAGTSISAGRLLSAVCGTLSAATMFLAIRRCLYWQRAPTRCDQLSTRAPAAFVAPALLGGLLVAWHFLQVHYGRTVRMYSLGVLLAGLASWLLVEAISRARSWPWWTGYVCALSALCYTHTFGVLTAGAHLVFMVGDAAVTAYRGSSLGSGRRVDSAVAARKLRTFAVAGGIVMVLYSPWLPVMLRQRETVWTDFWIPALTFDEIARVHSRSVLGLEGLSRPERWAVSASALGLILYHAWRPTRAGWYFLTQSLTVWVVAIGVSVWTARPVFLERCLLFAQLGWLGLVAVTVFRLPGQSLRWIAAVVLTATSAWGTWAYLRRLPAAPHPVEQAATILSEQWKAGDAVVVGNIVELFRIQGYGAPLGIPPNAVRAAISPIRTERSHELLNLAVDASETVEHFADPMIPAPRLWLGASSPPGAVGPTGYVLGRRWAFRGEEGAEFHWAVWVRGP